MSSFQTGFVSIPKTVLPDNSIVQPFEVSQYYCSRDDSGKAVVSPSKVPWVDVTFQQAVNACAHAGGSLLNERQFLAIALQVLRNPLNWRVVDGVRVLKQGLRLSSVSTPQPGNFPPPDASEDRWFYVDGDARICDFAGNIFGWIFDNVQGNKAGIIDRPFASRTISLTIAPHASLTHGMGAIAKSGDDWEGQALIRGGGLAGGDNTGVFRMRGCWPDQKFDHVGFRLARAI